MRSVRVRIEFSILDLLDSFPFADSGDEVLMSDGIFRAMLSHVPLRFNPYSLKKPFRM
jgi:hypothetical protein